MGYKGRQISTGIAALRPLSSISLSTHVCWKIPTTRKIPYSDALGSGEGSSCSDMHKPRAKCWLRTLDSTSRLLSVVLCMVLLACAAPATHRDITPVATPLSLHSGATLAVIGVRRGESQPGNGASASVDDRRVGFGLTSLLAEFFFATGKFRLVEEKDVRKREFLEDLVSTYWVEPRAPYGLQEL